MGGAGLGERRGRDGVRERSCRVSALIESWRRETSARSCSTSVANLGGHTAETEGTATSTTLSARSASSSREYWRMPVPCERWLGCVAGRVRAGRFRLLPDPPTTAAYGGAVASASGRPVPHW